MDLRNLKTQLFQAISIFPLFDALAFKFPLAVQIIYLYFKKHLQLEAEKCHFNSSLTASAVPEEFTKTFTFQKMDFQPCLVTASQAHQNLETVPSGVAFKSVNLRTVVSS